MLLFSEYNRSLKNISISQPIVDVDIEDTNSIIIRYPKFRRATHLILSYDAQNLFTKEKNGYGYFMDLENTLQEQEDNTENGYFVIGVTSNSSRKKQYNPYPRLGRRNHAIKHIDNIMNDFLPQIIGDYDIDYSYVKKIVLGSSMGGLMSFKTSIMYPQFDNVVSFSPAFWYGYPGIEEDLQYLSQNTLCNLSVGSDEGEIFGDEARNIFPNEWELDFSSNDNFYISGVNKILKILKQRNIKTNFVFQDSGKHNEETWSGIFKVFLKSL
tara:strand:- start:3807 stop:4613 length:807 start_codon:yes stop_codon:yes gene_type:complete